MISPIQIALGGLAPGSSPVTIATQGLVITIEPAPKQDALWIPLRSFGPPNSEIYDSRKKKSKRVDCVVSIEGCRATLSTYEFNVATHTFNELVIPMATRFLENILEWRELCRWKALPQNASRRRAKAEELLTGRREKRQLRADADRFVAEIGLQDHPNAGRLLHSMVLENQRLQKLLAEKSS